ncbi:conserved hypothetical protein [Ricinus communis]|uniref:Uncharacterized protein n=1 Tax=Ricinus communis TaxID=3988 RepID=B9RB83_RICCO|nr:conserved hypothetical protein [Ricinus communis]
MARNTLDFSSTFQQHQPTAIIMPSSSSLLFPLTLHPHHHYPPISTTSFFTTQLHIPKPKQEKQTQQDQEEEEEEEEKEGNDRGVLFPSKGSNSYSGESSVSVRSFARSSKSTSRIIS